MNKTLSARLPALAAAIALALTGAALAQTPAATPAANGAPPAGGMAAGPNGEARPPMGGASAGCSSNAAVPQAGQLMAKGSTRRDTPNPNGEPPAAPTTARNQLQQHVAQVKEALKLTAEQQPYWDSYQEMVSVLARDRNQAAQYAAKAADSATPMPERMQARIQTLATKCNTLNRMSQQIVLLYNALTPEQQKIANELDLDPEAVKP